MNSNKRQYNQLKPQLDHGFNRWDFLGILIFVSLLGVLAWSAKEMVSPFHLGQMTPISLSPKVLFNYALRTVSRMGIALIISLLVTLCVAAWAAKSKWAGKILIPLIDIFQSVPVLSFLALAFTAFIRLFPNSMLGPECAAIFAIFCAQAWNMILGMYQSLISIPADLEEVSQVFQLSAWQRFWRLEVPFSLPSLLWNTMMSVSASWFFIVYAEAITFSQQTISLPGIGSYIALAIAEANLTAVVYAILAMFVVILIYDQLLFRPLITWSEKFKFDYAPDEKFPQSWFINLVKQSSYLRFIGFYLNRGMDSFINFSLLRFNEARSNEVNSKKRIGKKIGQFLGIMLIVLLIASLLYFGRLFLPVFTLSELKQVLLLGLATSCRVFSVIVISSLIWVPIGVYIGSKRNYVQNIQALIQFMASFPANLFYPLAVMLIMHFHLNPQIWVTVLMILGTQWYIVFNVIAGSQAIPKELRYVANNFGVSGWQWWKRLALPAIFPYYITGAITAAGGAWNASIVAEFLSWGNTRLETTGLGAYIQASTNAGDFPKIALGTVVMCVFVLFFNTLIWRPLYGLAEKRFRIL